MSTIRFERFRIEPRLAHVLGELHETPFGPPLVDRLEALVSAAGPSPSGGELEDALAAYRRLLDRAAGDGIVLTAAGYLSPADTRALAAVLPLMDDWIFPVTREVHAHPVLGFREHVQRVGLLRKLKGRLVLTTAGTRAQADATRVWEQLVERLIPATPRFDSFAWVLLLLHSASAAAGEKMNVGWVARAMTQLGWRQPNGSPVTQRMCSGCGTTCGRRSAMWGSRLWAVRCLTVRCRRWRWR